jgi:hypothetical protein
MTAHWEQTGQQKISRKLAKCLGIKPGVYKIGPEKPRQPRAPGPIRDADAHPDIEIPAGGDAAGAARRRGFSSPSAAWFAACRMVRRVEDSLLGDAIGGAFLAVTMIVLFIIAGVM